MLDEADEMLNMGFYKDVRGIIDLLKSRESLSMFSATISLSLIHISIGNTAQFPPCGLSTAPAAAARHLRCQNAR